jgi:hypothetical protein
MVRLSLRYARYAFTTLSSVGFLAEHLLGTN